MVLDVLEDLGFSAAEAKTYFVLLKLGSSVKVGKIIEKSGLQSSTIHNILNGLIERGFVTYVLKGNVRHYQAISPELLLESYKAKEKKFEEMLPELKSYMSHEKRQSAEIYEGIKGVMALLHKLLSDAKEGDVYYFFAVDASNFNEDIQEFFRQYDIKRSAKKLSVRGLARKELKPLFEDRSSLNVRYVDFPIPSGIIICNNNMALINWESLEEGPSGVLVQSKQIVESQTLFFEELWKKAKR